MTPSTIHLRRGMTLVELMVVVMILGLLAVVVLPNVSGTLDSRRNREASRNLSSFAARAQSRALEAEEPKGLMLQPLSANPAACIDIFFADTPSAYAGELMTSRATLAPPVGTPTEIQVFFDTNTDTRLRLQPDFCRYGDSIQFGGTGPYFKFIPPEYGTSDPFRIGMWTSSSQVPANTGWPRATGTGATYRIRRQPTRASTGVLQLQRGAAIDLAWSCIGSRPLFAPGYPPVVTVPNEPISLLFDATGKPTQLVHSGGTRTIIGEPLFLLVGGSEIAGNPYSPGISGDAGEEPEDRGGANWQYTDCVWLCVDNNSGVVKFGPMAPRATSVLESQLYVRMTIGLGAAER